MALTKTRLLKHDFPVHGECSGEIIDVRSEGGVALHLPEVSRENFLPKTDRATRGCRGYTHTSRATLSH